MIGAVVGDALGAPFEFVTEGALNPRDIEKKWQRDYYGKPDRRWRYTDDTAMARQVRCIQYFAKNPLIY